MAGTPTTTNKIKVRDKEMELEDKDYALIMAIKDLTIAIRSIK